MAKWLTSAKKLLPPLPLALLLLFIPGITHAATAFYTNTTSTTLPGDQSGATLTSNIAVPDDFSIADLDVTLNLNGDIHFLEAGLTGPSGARVVLYDHNRRRGTGTRFRQTTFDDEATDSITGSHEPWVGHFRSQDPLSRLDGTSAAGTWTLDLKYSNTGTITPNDITLHSWTLTFEGAGPSTIAGTKYHDKDGNGVHDSGEAGLSGWTLFLDLNNDTELDSGEGEPSTTTDDEGHYQFSHLDINDHVVREFFQPSWFQTAPRGNRLPVRTRSGQTAGDTNFGNIPEAETTASPHTNATTVPIQDDGEAVRAQSPITVPESFPVVDTNVIINANAPLFATRFTLMGPDGTRVVLFREGSTGVIGGDQFRGTTFDDQATQTIGESGDRPPFINTYRPKEFLTALNQASAGDWTLEALDTKPGTGTSGEILSWTLELRTPAMQEPEPVIIVPGMGASYNRERMINDRAGGTWGFAPTIDWFDALIQRLKAEGYVEGETLFISHYDWRQSNTTSAQEFLIPTINQAKQASDSSKVDIVAHSMGGLVTRAYVQGAQYQNDVDQFIVLGTPNRGAADAYAAWEGGILPERWGVKEKFWMGRREYHAKKARGLSHLKPPQSFRAVFPFLRELLPTTPFVKRDGTTLQPSQLTEQNTFLQNLSQTQDLLVTRVSEVATIAGKLHSTLGSVPITILRSPKDITLDRWRDGSANPDPPQADSTEGDQTVLVSSVHSLPGDTVTLSNVKHDELPSTAQDEVVRRLLGTPQHDFVPFRLASSALGFDILSPLMPTVTGPNGEVLSSDTNTFTEAVFDWNPADPNEPKLLTITDPPQGKYTIKLTGTATGEYSVLTTFADKDELIFSERTGNTQTGKVETYLVQVGENTFRAPPEDIFTLAEKLWRAIPRLWQEKHIKNEAVSPLLAPAGTMYGYASAYKSLASLLGLDHPTTQQYFNLLKQEFQKFSSELNKQISLGRLDSVAIEELVKLQVSLKDAGL